jgi:hypothetical protein
MALPSRMQLARRRLRVARYSIGAAAVSAFAVFGFAVRNAHPATHNAATPVATTDGNESSSSFGGDAAISPAPQFSAPTIQSGGS